MPTVISRICLDRLLSEAAASPGREICGLLFGAPDRIDGAEPALNVSPTPATTFEIDPRALIAAHRAQRAGGRTLIGHYHSHPTGPASPSPCDLAAAEAGTLWLILGEGEARLWRATETGFAQIPLVLA